MRCSGRSHGTGGARSVPPRITVAFSSHRPETLGAAAGWMRLHEVIVLEEPPNDGFPGMLDGRLDVDEYLVDTDFEFPIFARRSCELHRELHARGKTILQIDPFLERLERIHDRFAAGETPADVEADGRYSEVYRRERAWTGALLRYYESAARDDFDSVVAALQAFTRADAARGAVRDRLRAEALVHRIPDDRSVYVEAGEVHFNLLGELRSRLEPARPVAAVHLMEPVRKALTGKRCDPGPGDRLTWLYTRHPEYRGPRADRLAGRALLHVKILSKTEVDAAEGEFPHTHDEIECNRLVAGLSYEDCRRLFARVRSMPVRQARETVAAERTG